MRLRLRFFAYNAMKEAASSAAGLEWINQLLPRTARPMHDGSREEGRGRRTKTVYAAARVLVVMPLSEAAGGCSHTAGLVEARAETFCARVCDE